MNEALGISHTEMWTTNCPNSTFVHGIDILRNLCTENENKLKCRN